MKYQIIIEKRAQKDAETVSSAKRLSVDKAILSLSENPRPTNSKKLTDKEGYRLKVGDFRILYTIDDKSKVVVIYRIKKRNEATYK